MLRMIPVFSLCFFVVSLTETTFAQECNSTPVTIGYRDFFFDIGSVTAEPTEEKPESKLWYNDNFWWGVLWDPAVKAHRIHRFDVVKQCWQSVGPSIDDRPKSSSDVLWDGTKLYISSHTKQNHKQRFGPATARIYRLSYDGSTNSYLLDAPFPVDIPGSGITRAMVLAKDSTGKLWVTWTDSGKIRVNRTDGNDQNWGKAFDLPEQKNDLLLHLNGSTLDISSIVAFGGDKIGIIWGNQNKTLIQADRKYFFSVHQDGDSDTLWQQREDVLPALTATSVRKPVADDHLNLTAIHGGPHDGTVLAVLKLGIGGAGNPRVVVAKRTPGGVWTHSVFGLGAEDHTRPIIVYDSGVDSVYVFASSGRSDPGTVYMKSAHINDLTNNVTFPPGFGRVFIKSEIDSKVNNPTSTKQSLNPSTGLLVQWGDRNSRYYLHNYMVSSNHAPLAEPDTVAPQGEGALLIDVTKNDSDPDGTINKTTVSIVEAPINGTATVDTLTGVVTYIPNPGFPGNDRFRYTVRDDKNVSAPAATVTITGTLTSPIASDDAGATDEDMPVVLNVLANDSDADGILDSSTASVVSGPSQGVTTVDTVSGEITYTPAANFFGADSFTYTVKDNDGVSSNIATVTISVSSINDSPIAFDDAARLAKDTAMALQVLNNDVDVDGVINPASVAIVSGPNNGSTSIDVTTGAITFTPDFGFIGQSIFTYTVQDNDGVASNTATVTVTVADGLSDIWISAEEIAGRPITGEAWNRLLAAADSVDRLVVSGGLNSIHDVTTMAAALVAVRLNDDARRQVVTNNIIKAVNAQVENDGNSVALTRTVTGYIIAADLIDLKNFAPAQDDLFRGWLERVVYQLQFNGLTLADKHEIRANNQGAQAGVVRIAAAMYLNKPDDLNRAAQVFRGWLGNRASYSGFNWGNLCWQVDPNSPSGILPKGSTMLVAGQVRNVDGVLPVDQRRALCPDTETNWPPTTHPDVWQGLQGAVGQAYLLTRAGFDALNWEDQAILRAISWQSDPNRGNALPNEASLWTLPLIDHVYGSQFWDAYPVGNGSQVGWTDWTHGGEKATQLTLRVHITGAGRVDLGPPGSSYAPGTQVHMTAIPDDGWIFVGWSSGLTGLDNQATITMNSLKDITALFSEAANTIFVTPVVSTTATPSNADDPAIWIHPTQPQKSIIIGTDKTEGIFVWDMNGNQLQHIPQGTNVNNVDVRQNVPFGNQVVDIVAANLRDAGKLAVFKVNPDYVGSDILIQLAGVNSQNNDIQQDSYGFTLYKRPSDGALFVFDKPKGGGKIRQYRIANDGTDNGVIVTAVRDLNYNGSIAEGYVADDKLGFIYIAEEDLAIHKYYADPALGSDPITSFASGDGTASDREGVALYKCSNGAGYLILSSQGNSTMKIYDRQGNNRFLKTVVPLDDNGNPGLGTDGLDVSSAAVPNFPNGFLVIHDNDARRFHVYDWAQISQDDLTICVDGAGLPRPYITSFSPANGAVGTEVTVIGGNLSDVTTVSFNETEASTLHIDSDSQLRAVVPSGAATGLISITGADGSALSASDFTVTIAQDKTSTFLPVDDTFVRSTRPDNHYSHSAELRVRLSSTDYDSYLKFNVTGLSAPVQSAALRLYVINGSPQGGSLYSVSNNFKGSSTPWSEAGLTFNNAPGITGSPLSALSVVSIGQTVEFDVTQAISGNGVFSFALTNNISNAVKYSSKEGVASPELIITTGSSSSQLPAISSFSPTTGTTGMIVTIRGNHFNGATDVSFNGVAASSFTVDSNIQVRATVPVGAATGPITVTTDAGSGTSVADFILSAPLGLQIAFFTPFDGSPGTEVTIRGSNFTGAATVSFNGTLASSFTVDSDAQIRAVVPNGATSGPISVTNPGGTATSSDNFIVTATPPAGSLTFHPTDDAFVRSTRPDNHYSHSAELRVRLSSTDYDSYLKFKVTGLSAPVQSATLRLYVIDGSPQGGSLYSVSNNFKGSSTPWSEAGLTFNNAPEITGSAVSALGVVSIGQTVEFDVTPAISGNGVFSFALTNNISNTVKYSSKEGIASPELVITTGSSSSQLPAISSFSPTTGTTGTEVTISGNHFSGATDVSFNGVAASSFTVDSNIQVRATVPVGAATGPITVTTGTGSGTSAADFILSAPLGLQISFFTPFDGSPGTEVTIRGSNFTGAATVSFNGTLASSFTVDSDAQIRAVVPNGATSGPISVSNPGGTATSSDNFIVTATPPAGTLTFHPMDDAFVRSTRPDNHYSHSAELRVRLSSTDYDSYLKFKVTGLSAPVQSAALRLYVINGSPQGGSLYSVSNNFKGSSTSWSEAGLTFTNAPVISGSPLSALSVVSIGQTVEFDVTPAISGNGVFSFALTNKTSNTAKYSSKEGATAPELVITMDTGLSAAKMPDTSSVPSEGSQSSLDIPETALVPDAFELGQNYPNPFNPTTTIEFSVPVQSQVAVSIYNVRGELVRTLVSQEMPPGRHKAIWDSKNGSGVQVASGIYVYRIEANNSALKTEKGFVSSRRLVLMR